MECFEDRSHAGRLLAELLAPYRERSDVVVLRWPLKLQQRSRRRSM
jgi:predicted phosphoribosyltransferase